MAVESRASFETVERSDKRGHHFFLILLEIVNSLVILGSPETAEPLLFSETVTVEATLYDPNGTAVQTYDMENEATHYIGSVAPLVGSAPEEDAPLAVATNQLIMAIWESGQLEAQAWR